MEGFDSSKESISTVGSVLYMYILLESATGFAAVDAVSSAQLSSAPVSSS